MRELEERPNPLRSRIVDQYIKSVLHPNIKDDMYKGTGKPVPLKDWVSVVEQIYRLNVDNRILNNLRQQLNEMILDERGLVSVDVFEKMFFTYFKGQRFAHQIYDTLLPLIKVCYDEENDVIREDGDPNRAGMKFIVKIQLLTQFIDLLNYYPVKVNKLRYKNDSHEVTYVMSSNTKGTKNERGESFERGTQEVRLTPEQLHINKLLGLVSSKIAERFVNLQSCFRFLDVDHT